MNDSIWCGIYCFIRDNAAILVAFMSFVVSGLALRHSIISSKRDQRHKELSVRPLIGEYKHVNHNGEFYYSLKNNGIGPAIIKNVKYYWLDEEFDKSDEFWDALVFFVRSRMSVGFMNVIHTIVENETVLKDNDTVGIVRGALIKTNDNETKDFALNLNACRIRVEYEDIYGNFFIYDSQLDLKNQAVSKHKIQ